MHPKKKLVCDRCNFIFGSTTILAVHQSLYCKGERKALPNQSTQAEPASGNSAIPQHANLEQKAYMEVFNENLYFNRIPSKREAIFLIPNHPAQQYTNYVPVRQSTPICTLATSNEYLTQSDSWVKKNERSSSKGETVASSSLCIQSDTAPRTQNFITISDDVNLGRKTSMEVLNKNLHRTLVSSKPEAKPSIAIYHTMLGAIAQHANLERKAYMEVSNESLYSKREANSLIANHPAQQYTNYVPVRQSTPTCTLATSNESLTQSDSWVKKNERSSSKGETVASSSLCIQSDPTSRTHNSLTISDDVNLEHKTSMEVFNRNLYYTPVSSKPEAKPLIASHPAQERIKPSTSKHTAAVSDESLIQTDSRLKENERFVNARISDLPFIFDLCNSGFKLFDTLVNRKEMYCEGKIATSPSLRIQSDPMSRTRNFITIFDDVNLEQKTSKEAFNKNLNYTPVSSKTEAKPLIAGRPAEEHIKPSTSKHTIAASDESDSCTSKHTICLINSELCEKNPKNTLDTFCEDISSDKSTTETHTEKMGSNVATTFLPATRHAESSDNTGYNQKSNFPKPSPKRPLANFSIYETVAVPKVCSSAREITECTTSVVDNNFAYMSPKLRKESCRHENIPLIGNQSASENIYASTEKNTRKESTASDKSVTNSELCEKKSGTIFDVLIEDISTDGSTTETDTETTRSAAVETFSPATRLAESANITDIVESLASPSPTQPRTSFPVDEIFSIQEVCSPDGGSTECTISVVHDSSTMLISSVTGTDGSPDDLLKQQKKSSISNAKYGIAKLENFANTVPCHEEPPTKLSTHQRFPAQEEETLPTRKIFPSV